MSKTEAIRHEGIVENIGADSCSVRILQASACSSCSARQLCRSSESKEKVIEVRGNYPTLHVGDSVVLVGSVRQGMRASVLAYVVPLVLMLAALFVGTYLAGEGIGALTALLVLALYYGGLFLLRDKLRKTFEFRIEVSSTTNL
ncbi:MAG: SoxR reducing system RseC family protein [Bacteroidaceae bacterium]|nr:SoxR reducing system RseC family protein [Bacteroidaceae bacterium]